MSHRIASDVVRDWVRALKPGGLLRIAVPDFEKIARAYLAGEPCNVQGYIMGGHADADDRHGTIYDTQALTGLMERCGLTDIEPWVSEVADCAALPISLNLQGRKPTAQAMKIAAVMSVPRLGFTDNLFATHAFPRCGVELRKVTGAFWGQCLERGIMACLDEGFTHVVTCDYDSVFAPADVKALVDLARANPKADAIAPVQMGRGFDVPLVSLPDADGNPRTDVTAEELRAVDLANARSAHFGLTIIRADALRSMPHPWFIAEPAPDGTWGDGRTDDDMRFWREWIRAGRSIWLAPRVVIGHALLMVKWPDQKMRPIYQDPSDFWKSGRPPGCWS